MIDQFSLFGGSPAPEKSPVYQNMDIARQQYGGLIGRPARWVREVKHCASDLGGRGEDGLVTKAIHGEGMVIGVSGGIDAYNPRLIVHECDCCRNYDPKAICAKGKGTWWVDTCDVTVETKSGYRIASDVARGGAAAWSSSA